MAGLALVLGYGPKLPAGNTGRMPAARRACTSGCRERSQPGPLPSDQEALTTRGASAVVGSRSGSRTHWKAWWSAVRLDRPALSKTRAAMNVAPGAVPTAVPVSLLLPPTMTPVTPVP